MSRKWDKNKFSRKKLLAIDSVVPEDDPAKVRKAIEAQDAAFRGALIAAIEAGLEKLPTPGPNPLEGLPKRVAPLITGSPCSSATGWDF